MPCVKKFVPGKMFTLSRGVAVHNLLQGISVTVVLHSLPVPTVYISVACKRVNDRPAPGLGFHGHESARTSANLIENPHSD